MMRLGFVFTNYNNSHFTRAAIESIAANCGGMHSIIVVVDNKSTNDDIEGLKAIQQEYSHIHIIYNGINVGYFGGLNLGLSYIKDTAKVEGVVIANNDVTFPKEFFTVVSENRELLEKYAVISPDIITLDGSHQNPHVVGEISSTRKFLWDLYYSNFVLSVIIGAIAKLTKRFTARKDCELYETAQTISQGYGACYLLGPQFFRYFDQLWAPTLLMGEELFLSKQLESIGMKVFYEPHIKVIHYDHASIGKMNKKAFWIESQKAYKIAKQYEMANASPGYPENRAADIRETKN